MGSPSDAGAASRGRGEAIAGFSWLCTTLAGIGLALSSAAAVTTFRLLHEPLEAVGASVVDHLASAKCTAIAKTLTGLTIAKQDVLNGEPEGERSPPDPHAVIGVHTPGRTRLEDFHATVLSEGQSLRVLAQLPPSAFALGAPSPVHTLLQRASGHVRHDLSGHSCNQLGYGLTPTAVRVFAAPGLPQGWVAFVYGPWRHDGQPKFSFALVDLASSTREMSGHSEAMDGLFPAGLHQDKLAIRITISQAAVLRDHAALHAAMPNLDREDHKLLGLKIVPFANQVVSTQLQIDHAALDRLSRRSAALVFLMGLLATAAVVLVSRQSERRLHRLNEALLKESRTDGLTRVANRRAWDEALAQEESRRQRFGGHYGLVVVDLDGFKRVNDQQGHQQGDQVLKAAAAQLAAQLRSADLLARVGGDEFALLLYNPDQAGLVELVNRLRQSLQAVGIEASIGAALSEERTTLDQTWAKADAAMYQDKSPTPSPPAASLTPRSRPGLS